MNESAEFKITAKEYLKARQNFLAVADKSDWLFGSDNLVGRIGEFIAYQYLIEHKRNPQRPKSRTQKGFDFICDDGCVKVSVKTITSENKTGSTTIICEPWDELILVIINEKMQIEVLGVITKTQFSKAIKAGHIKSISPYARRSMVGNKGLIKKYGNLVDKKITNKYL